MNKRIKFLLTVCFVAVIYFIASLPCAAVTGYAPSVWGDYNSANLDLNFIGFASGSATVAPNSSYDSYFVAPDNLRTPLYNAGYYTRQMIVYEYEKSGSYRYAPVTDLSATVESSLDVSFPVSVPAGMQAEFYAFFKVSLTLINGITGETVLDTYEDVYTMPWWNGSDGLYEMYDDFDYQVENGGVWFYCRTPVNSSSSPQIFQVNFSLDSALNNLGVGTYSFDITFKLSDLLVGTPGEMSGADLPVQSNPNQGFFDEILGYEPDLNPSPGDDAPDQLDELKAIGDFDAILRQLDDFVVGDGIKGSTFIQSFFKYIFSLPFVSLFIPILPALIITRFIMGR